MTRPTVFILNGSNLNLLGQREPELYGSTTLALVQQRCESLAGELGLACEFRQTNHEGVLVDWLQEAFAQDAAVILNPAGFSFHSIPVLDAVKLIRQPVVEVHITNIHQRSAEYQRSLVSLAATGVICGLGWHGYLLALRHIAQTLAPAA